MKLNRKILMVLSIVLSLAMATGGTLAYLTDRESTANVFAIGDVRIDLNEDFDRGAQLVPGVNIEKKPTITNTGSADAWVWLTFSIPSALDNYIQGTEAGSNENIIHWNPMGATTEGYVTDERVNKALQDGFFDDVENKDQLSADYIKQNNMTWNVFNSLGEGKNIIQEKINGVDYNTYVLLYNKALTPGETTLPNIAKVFLDARVDIDPEGDWYFVEKGEVTPLDWNTYSNSAPVIHVSAYAMQKEGFASVKEAYDAYTAQWTTDAGVNNGAAYTEITKPTPNNGAVRPAGMEIPADGKISNVTILDGSDKETNLRALYKDGLTTSIEITDSLFDGTYALNLTTKTAGLTLTADNSTFMGWTSYAGWESAAFTDCAFTWNSEGTYGNIRPYDDTTFTNCEFSDVTFMLDMLDGSKVTLVNCTYNGEKIISADQLNIAAGDASSVIINNK